MVGGKKLGGILSEAKNGAVVIGIGINVQSKLKTLPDVATSLSEFSSFPRLALTGSLGTSHRRTPLRRSASDCSH